MSKKKSTEEFIKEAKGIHGNKYDYSKVEYVNNSKKVCIICPIHGEFWQTPNNHLKGHNCPKCVGNGAYKLTTDEFIEKANKIHNKRYDYSKVTYINDKTKVCIICPEHGEFWQTPNCHLQGQTCPKCARDKRIKKLQYTKDNFLEKACLVHGKKYDYSKVDYIDSQTKVNVICPVHGEFWQRPDKHLIGEGCPVCGRNVTAEKISLNKDDFIRKSYIKHGNKYDYTNVEFCKCSDRVHIICPIHGDFYQTVSSHLQGHGCPKCGNIQSKAEYEIIEGLKPLEVEHQNKSILNGKEIDIYIPSKNIGIEYNGLRWHSEEFGKGRNYHLDKLNECINKGVALIQIFEDEWVNHKEICISKIQHVCNISNLPKIFARKCKISEIKDKNEVYFFLEKNHIQGKTGFTLALGAYYNNNLVGVMTFVKEKQGYWVLNRFATDIRYQSIGIAGKLFKYFIRNFEFKEIKSFADRRWTINYNDNLYTKIGFKFVSFVAPNYTYYDLKNGVDKRFHKFAFRKQKLHKRYGLPLTMTETEMTQELGYTKIWDCGLIKYVYDNNI